MSKITNEADLQPGQPLRNKLSGIRAVFERRTEAGNCLIRRTSDGYLLVCWPGETARNWAVVDQREPART